KEKKKTLFFNYKLPAMFWLNILPFLVLVVLFLLILFIKFPVLADPACPLYCQIAFRSGDVYFFLLFFH
ncbi:hypothetical protein, partial [Priestia aryabhattai]|uniref:hypothetical protein n=1 Tax=Priestia aryabhattai TaxID=412384 RepID=UPI00197AC1AC